MRIVLKVRRKGILILPKKLREAIGVYEGDDVITEVKGDKLILKPLKPKVVDVDQFFIEKLLKEEYEAEKKKYEGMFHYGETGS